MRKSLIPPNDTLILSGEQPAASPLTSDAYFETGSKPRTYALSVHAGMLKVKNPQSLTTPLPAAGHVRGKIKGFSRASRKRMIEFMACVRGHGSFLFLTLTYPDQFPPDSDTWHRHFEAFRDRFEHHYPKYRMIWRLETMDRKSGENTGVVAPHWHGMVFLPEIESAALDDLSSDIQGEIRQMWYEIVSSGDADHLLYGADVCPVRSVRHAMKYISKYIAKTGFDNLEIGRRWGRFGIFDTSPSIIAGLTFDEYVVFKRLVRNWMRKRRGKFYRDFARISPFKGASVFGIGDDESADWFAFVYEAFRQVADARQRERGHGT